MEEKKFGKATKEYSESFPIFKFLLKRNAKNNCFENFDDANFDI